MQIMHHGEDEREADKQALWWVNSMMLELWDSLIGQGASKMRLATEQPILLFLEANRSFDRNVKRGWPTGWGGCTSRTNAPS